MNCKVLKSNVSRRYLPELYLFEFVRCMQRFLKALRTTSMAKIVISLIANQRFCVFRGSITPQYNDETLFTRVIRSRGKQDNERTWWPYVSEIRRFSG